MTDVKNRPAERRLRAHAYIRVSTTMQAEEGTSLEVQEERCRAAAESRGWDLVAVHTDAGVSGAKADRPALSELLVAVRRDEVDAVLTTKLDRLGRSQINLVPLLAELDERDVVFWSLHESFDGSTPVGRMLRTMLGGFAEFERDLIRERTRSGSRKRVEMGGWGGGDAPYGYRIDRSGRFPVAVPDERESHMIKTVLTMLLDEGLRTRDVVDRLNALGMTPRKASLWNNTNLRNMLRRGQFDGQWVFCKPSSRVQGEPIRVTLPAIITSDRMQQLQEYLDATAIQRGADREVHPLSGRLICPCGQPMTGLTRSDRSNRRYRCRHHPRIPGKPRCGQPSVLADVIDHAVWDHVLAVLTDPNRLAAAARERLGPTQIRLITDEDIAVAQGAVDRCRRAIAGVTAKALALDLDEDTLALTVSELKTQLAAALNQRQSLQAQLDRNASHEDHDAAVARIATFAKVRLRDADQALRARILEALDITVHIESHAVPIGITLRVEGQVPQDFAPTSGTDNACHLSIGAAAAG